MADRKPDDNGERTPTWYMPDWMEEYRPLIESVSGGSSTERCMNLTGEQTRNNLYMSAICLCVDSRVNLLQQLRSLGKI